MTERIHDTGDELILSDDQHDLLRVTRPTKLLGAAFVGVHVLPGGNVHVVDRVRTREHPRDQGHHLAVRVRSLVRRTVNRPRASRSTPVRRASRSIETRPADDTRFGSSKTADNAPGACFNCSYEMPLRSVEQLPIQSLFFSIREIFPRHRTRSNPTRSVDRGLVSLAARSDHRQHFGRSCTEIVVLSDAEAEALEERAPRPGIG